MQMIDAAQNEYYIFGMHEFGIKQKTDVELS
jgi:hypothetical protein